jgi:ribA/ribD-fused uncharacterized protein
VVGDVAEEATSRNFTRSAFDATGRLDVLVNNAAVAVAKPLEHYFQAQKHAGSALAEEIRQADRPREAFTLGRSRPPRPDWPMVRDAVMYRAVKAKFVQHPELRALLLSTADAQLVEHTTNDDYWGDGGDGSGRNMLGRALMRVREELRAADTEPPAAAGRPRD